MLQAIYVPFLFWNKVVGICLTVNVLYLTVDLNYFPLNFMIVFPSLYPPKLSTRTFKLYIRRIVFSISDNYTINISNVQMSYNIKIVFNLLFYWPFLAYTYSKYTSFFSCKRILIVLFYMTHMCTSFKLDNFNF